MSDGRLRVCRGCGKYTMGEKCPGCGGAVRRPDPARYSPEDRYGRYRRALFAAANTERAAGIGPKEE